MKKRAIKKINNNFVIFNRMELRDYSKITKYVQKVSEIYAVIWLNSNFYKN